MGIPSCEHSRLEICNQHNHLILQLLNCQTLLQSASYSSYLSISNIHLFIIQIIWSSIFFNPNNFTNSKIYFWKLMQIFIYFLRFFFFLWLLLLLLFFASFFWSGLDLFIWFVFIALNFFFFLWIFLFSFFLFCIFKFF